MWEKESRSVEEINLYSSWAMTLCYGLVLITCLPDAVAGVAGKYTFLPGYHYTMFDIGIGAGVAAVGGIWIVIYKKFPTNRVFKIITSIIAAVMCYIVNVESNVSYMSVPKAIYS